MSETNIQICLYKLRRRYKSAPLMEQLCIAHGVTQREFAAIFGVSKQHALKIIKHRVFPSLELGIRISRYWGKTVEDIFGWRVDDGGERCPLMVLDLKTGKRSKASVKKKRDGNRNDALRVVARLKASCEENG